ncbi:MULTISPECIES: hypothetical protein [unclassified Sphingomonas]|nr:MULTISPECIES: hypothetical protein [unclassified Sphingomonas]MBN8849276.1 hypothetical protein [Sphingomonas sp.]OJV29964.1 MAG: hypothetical protein BGO24_14000 [Sphingomonas sp. 67-36]
MIRMSSCLLSGVAALLCASTAGAKQWVDYSPTKGFWDINAIEVDPNHVDDYLTGLKRTQVPVFEALKKRGLVDDYRFLVRNGYTKNSPSVVIMAHFTNAAALEPNRARDEAIEKEIVAGLSENDAKAAVAGYEKYRTFIDDALYNEVSFAK